jgi:hypothetical protein
MARKYSCFQFGPWEEEIKMKSYLRRFALFLMASVAAPTASLGLTKSAEAGGQVTIGVTETIASHNPYADSISMGYAIWCQV